MSDKANWKPDSNTLPNWTILIIISVHRSAQNLIDSGVFVDPVESKAVNRHLGGKSHRGFDLFY